MANLNTNPAEDIYNSILSLLSGNITASFKRVTDGDNNNTALGVSNNAVKSYGDLDADGDSNIVGTVTATDFVGDGSNLTGISAGSVSGRTITTTATMNTTDDVIYVNVSGNESLTLVPAASYTNKTLKVILIGTGSIEVGPDGSETINGASLKSTTTQYHQIHFTSNGTEWFAVEISV